MGERKSINTVNTGDARCRRSAVGPKTRGARSETKYEDRCRYRMTRLTSVIYGGLEKFGISFKIEARKKIFPQA
jgi:hypothetical protein